MTRHRTHGIAFKRQVAQEFIAGVDNPEAELFHTLLDPLPHGPAGK